MVFVLRKQNKCFTKFLLAIAFAHFGSHYVQEVIEVYEYLTFFVFIFVSVFVCLVVV